MQTWHIAVELEPERTWEGNVTADGVIAAVTYALRSARILDSEALHMVHVSPPKD